MRPQSELLFFVLLFVLSLALAAITPIINQNTLPMQGLNDNERYFDFITKQTSQMPGIYVLLPLTWFGKDFFFFAMNFIFYLCISTYFLGFTKDKTITLLAILCFSTSLATTFALYAQGMIIIVALAFWLRVEFDWKGNKVMEMIQWGAFAAFCFLVHRYGIFIWMTIFAAKVVPAKIPRQPVIVAYALICGLLLFGGVNSTMRLTFFYPTLLPIDLGNFNTVLWIACLSLPLFYMFITTERSEKSKRFVLFTYLGTFVFYLFVTHLEIDIWRMMILVDLVMLLEIARARAAQPMDPDDQDERNQFLDYVPILLLLFGVARIILGMKIL